MRALDRKLLRDLWHIHAQAVAIAAVVASGVAIYVMASGTLSSLAATRDAFYDRYRFADVFAPLERAPELLSSRLAAIEGVKRVETRIVKNVTLDVPGLDEPATARLISLPKRGAPVMNVPAIARGRMPEPDRVDEALVNVAFAEANGLSPGDRLTALINGHKRHLRIVGTARSPEYVIVVAAGALMPDDRRFAVMWMPHEALAAAFDLDNAFNDVTVSLLRGVNEADVIAALDVALGRYGGTGAYGRKDQFSDSYLRGEMDQLKTMATVVPPIFLAVAVFLVNVVISRLIGIERTQIGVLKAFGYRNREVAWHYVKFVFVIAGLGTAAGFAIGAWLGAASARMYAVYFSFPFLQYRPGLASFGIAALVVAAAAGLGTLGAVRRAQLLPPATAMGTPPPESYAPLPLERTGLFRHLRQTSLMMLRHIVNWPTRSSLTALGLAFSIALLVASLYFYDAIQAIIAEHFDRSGRQDATVTLVEARSEKAIADLRHLPGIDAIEPFRTVAARLRLGPRSERVGITGLDPGGTLRQVPGVAGGALVMPEDGIVLSRHLADQLGARRGDGLRVELLEGKRHVRRVAVAAVSGDFFGSPAYMSRAALNRLMGEGSLVSGAYVQLDPLKERAFHRRLKDIPAVAGVSSRRAALGTLRETLSDTMDVMIFFYVAFAGMIAVGVAYNSARIALSERGRELASMRVLGFTRGEVAAVLLGELALLTLAAVPVGCGLGYGLAWLFSRLFETDLFRVPFVIAPATYGTAVVVVLAIVAGAGWAVRRRIDRLDLIAVLKTRE